MKLVNNFLIGLVKFYKYFINNRWCSTIGTFFYKKCELNIIEHLVK